MGWPGPITHRQFLAWKEFDEAERRRPGLTEFYLMQVAHEARYAFAEKRRGFNSNDYLLRFQDEPATHQGNGKPAPRRKLSPEEFARQVAELKCRFAAGMRIQPTELGVDPKIFERRHE